MHFLSSSSSGSSRSGSPDTRATTPSETFDILPGNYVYMPNDINLCPEVLERVFAKHMSDNRMGFIVDHGIEPAFFASTCKDGWCEQTLFETTKYSVSTTYQPIIHTDFFIPTDPAQAKYHSLFSLSFLRSIISFKVAEHSTLYVLEKPIFVYPTLSQTITRSFAPSSDLLSGNVPTIEEWKALWSTWDLITLRMIPESMLHQKPIDLRHKCLFYIGHIPTFLDMLISKSIGGEATEPKYFWNIFERGIDPHVDNPDHCHNHSEVPEEDNDWPTLESIINFRDRVRARLQRLYDNLESGNRPLTRNIARTLVMTHEHEGFHIETLLYMLIQKAGSGTLPPPGFVTPPWEDLAVQWASNPEPSTPTVLVGPAYLTMGHDDSEADDQVTELAESIVRGHTFGWDNESPSRQVHVGAFRAEWRPVTNGEFMRFWKEAGKGVVQTPKSWVVESEGEDEGPIVKVRTMYGLVPMHVAGLWPVLASYDDLSRYAQAKGGRLPTEPELRLFLDLYDVGHEGGANVGFRNWHPFPATTGLDIYGGKGSNGGVWEWTSTVFDTHEGLVPTQLFTGYSTDFFDTKHQVALGASYATIPRLGRRTVRNFYQHNYPYPWIGARVVYDI